MSAAAWGKIATVIAALALAVVIFLIEHGGGCLPTFRFAKERPGEWHIGIWINRRVVSLRLAKWALIWSFE